jgi:antitoxin component YwqK of YwqJK toxin-antitoxin module
MSYSLNDVTIQVMQYLYPYDVKNTFFVDKDAHNNTQCGRKYKYNYYSNGQIYRKYQYYMDGNKVIKHGIYRMWYPNNQLQYEINYENGKFCGIWREWSKQGKLMIEMNLDHDGKRHGLYREWHCNGQLYEEIHYNHGKFHGAYRTFYYRDGSPMQESHYTNGILDGPSYTWCEHGCLKREDYYIDGTVIEQRDYECGKLI